eukprot:11842838-Prorocentrum_lima.AAC.1
MATSFFGAGHISESWKYLGAKMVSHGQEELEDGQHMNPDMRVRLVRETWEKPLRTIALRCDAITRKRMALSQRSQIWNTYIGAVIPYRAQLVAMDGAVRRQLAEQVRRCFATAGWCPWWAVTSLAVEYAHKNAPRCPL